MSRFDGRTLGELRPISFELGLQKHVAGSALIKWGDTHVLCAASIEERVPSFVEEGGWITAEYALLPGSTHSRVRRERKGPSGRSAEIQRLIGRSLRGAIDLLQLEGLALTLDCDVIQADGELAVRRSPARMLPLQLLSANLLNINLSLLQRSVLDL